MQLTELHVIDQQAEPPSPADPWEPALDYGYVSSGPQELTLLEEADGHTMQVLISPRGDLTGRKLARCKGLRSLGVNLISLPEAQRLDLSIEATSPTAKRLEGFRTVTRVGLVHAAYISNQDGSGVRAAFWVCQDLEESIVLGRRLSLDGD